MKALVITGSRADRNGLEVVHEALLKAGHESTLYQWRETGLPPCVVDVAVVGGDRSEILEAALWASKLRIPIAHVAGGDVTTGSADDRYRDAITALSCIHFATNDQAFRRLTRADSTDGPVINVRDSFYLTGSPAIDRIKQTPVLKKLRTFNELEIKSTTKPTALVCVHPKTVGPDPFPEAWAVREALTMLDMQCICLGANADKGGQEINRAWGEWCMGAGRVFAPNVSPQFYYSLMTHCDVMVGNSSAMLYEAPSFGLPCVLVGDRQDGRTQPDNIWPVAAEPKAIVDAIDAALADGHFACVNPYGDGNSAPRIVKALGENEWRWKHD